MAKILATEIRAGNLLEMDKRIWRVLKCHHVHVGGRGGAYMQVEMKDIEAGTKKNERIRTDEKVERAFVESRTMVFSYQEGESYIFMDNETYEQIELPGDSIVEELKYLKENMEVHILMYDTEVLGVELPNTVKLRVAETEPGIRGDTSSGGTKPATLETGATVNVPFFVNVDDELIINTQDGSYVSRA